MKHVFFLLLFTLLIGCDNSRPTNHNDASSNEETATPAVQDYIEQGDLEAIKERGRLRLLAPRFDGV